MVWRWWPQVGAYGRRGFREARLQSVHQSAARMPQAGPFVLNRDHGTKSPS